MIIISHRGNIDGQQSNLENSPFYIIDAIENKFDVEIDLWLENNNLFLGHDDPRYQIDVDFLYQNHNKLWIHCKNHDALSFCHNKKFNHFWHESDSYTLTSMGYIWAHPNANDFKQTIIAMPEKIDNFLEIKKNYIGICSDYANKYKDLLV